MTENLRTRNNAMVKSLGLLPASHISDLETPTGTDRKKKSPKQKPDFSSQRISKGAPYQDTKLVSSVQFSRSVVSDSLRPHELPHARPPCPSPTPGVHSNSGPSSRWCHPTISSSVVPFSSFQSFPAPGITDSFPMSQFFASGGQSIGVSASASVLPMNIQDWFPLG